MRKRTSERDVKRTEALERDLIGATALAEFVHLEPAGVTTFRNKYPDFAPAEWWDYLYKIDGVRVLYAEDGIKLSPDDPNLKTKMESLLVRQWQHTQELVRRAWKAEFNFKAASEISDLLKSVFYADRPELLYLSQVLLPSGTVFELNSKLYQFHKAVLFLQQHPWRVRVCLACGKRFVADHASRKYCSVPNGYGTLCAGQVIKNSKLKWGRENNWGRPKAKAKSH